MVASFVMVFAITGAIVVIQSGFRALDTARNTTLASQVIQSELERIRLLSWSSVDAMEGSAELDITTIMPAGATLTAKLDERFTVLRTVADVSGKTGSMKEILVTVSWTGLDGVSRSRTSTTHYAKNGLYDYYYSLAGS